MLTNQPRGDAAAAKTPLAGSDASADARPAGKSRKPPVQQAPAQGATERSSVRPLEATLASMRTSSLHVDNPGLVLQRLVDAGFGNLPLPGGGATLLRWQALAAVAAFDLSLAKLFEAHADAIAIQAELSHGVPADGSTWGVWCAEPPDTRLTLSDAGQPPRTCLLDGRKAWCAGAGVLNFALVSAWNAVGEQCLAAVPIDQPGITITEEGWQAVGMQRCDSVDVIFENAVAVPIGRPGAYTARAGFWHGSAGIAACWYGATAEIARRLHRAVSSETDAHGKAHLGAVDIALSGAAALLRETAAFIDANPSADAMQAAFRARLGVENAASVVIEHATRALGAGPLCRDAHFARMVADLPVFLRQSHAERDLQTLGESLAIAPTASAAQAATSATHSAGGSRAEQWKL